MTDDEDVVIKIQLCEVRRLVLTPPFERYRISIDPSCVLCLQDAGAGPIIGDTPAEPNVWSRGRTQDEVEARTEAEVDARRSEGMTDEEGRAWARMLRECGE